MIDMTSNVNTKYGKHYLFQISVSPDSRNTAWVSFDGRNRQELIHGDR